MIRINLIPSEYLLRQRQRLQIVRIAGIGVVLFAVILGFTLMQVRRTIAMEQELALKKAQLAKLEAQVEEVKQLESLKASISAHLNAIGDLLAARFHYTSFMRDLAASIPPTIYFDSVQTMLKPGATIDANMLVHSGSAEDVTNWLRTLETDPKFSKTVLGGMSVSPTGPAAFTFPLSFSYTVPINQYGKR